MSRRLMFGDALLAVLAVYAGYALRGQHFPLVKEVLFSRGHRVGLFVFIVILAGFATELYSMEKNRSRRELLLRTMASTLAAFITLSALYYMIPSFRLLRGVLGSSLLFFVTFQLLWHLGYRTMVAFPRLARRVLILGTGRLADQMGKVITGNGYSHVLLGYVNCNGEQILVPRDSVLNNGEKILETVRRERADQLVVSLSERRGVFPLQDVLACKMSGVDVVDAPSLYEEVTGKLLVENIDPSWFIFSDGFRATLYRRMFKRPFDILMSLTGLILCAPLFVIIPLMIACDSFGSSLFRQVRVGEGGEDFTLYKFRTMKNDAENGTGAVWSQKDDPRITRIGRFLRRTRLDEIPQLFNVLRGDMSLVGPRPERPEFVENLKQQIPYYPERHTAKPGITGWAQVKYPYGASVEDSMEKLRYDLYYVKRLSAFLDLTIITETVRVVLFGRGGR